MTQSMYHPVPVAAFRLQDLFCRYWEHVLIHVWRYKVQHSMTTSHGPSLVQGGQNTMGAYQVVARYKPH
jgi:hypothetical protein